MRKYNSEKSKLYCKRWREKNPDFKQDYGEPGSIKREKYNARKRAYRRTEKSKLYRNMLNRIRRSRVAGVAKSFLQVLRENQFKYGYICCENCERNITENYTIDHIIPISTGGGNSPNNLQVLCLPCNMEKGVSAIDFRVK